MVHSSHICRLGNGLIELLIIRDAKMRRRHEALQAASAIRHGQLRSLHKNNRGLSSTIIVDQEPSRTKP